MRCVLNEELMLPQSTLSYHMKILCESGVVEGRQEGKWTHYSISKEGILCAHGDPERIRHSKTKAAEEPGLLRIRI